VCRSVAVSEIAAAGATARVIVRKLPPATRARVVVDTEHPRRS
jgi:hypothetical protein